MLAASPAGSCAATRAARWIVGRMSAVHAARVRRNSWRDARSRILWGWKACPDSSSPRRLN